mmetsp:Transcript_59967/g.94986  ORF Transcript_59967/g.94986 Transcript_59967/m.94986 type:complete len:212 (-) Transcript_59967:1194-1829(-)
MGLPKSTPFCEAANFTTYAVSACNAPKVQHSSPSSRLTRLIMLDSLWPSGCTVQTKSLGLACALSPCNGQDQLTVRDSAETSTTASSIPVSMGGPARSDSRQPQVSSSCVINALTRAQSMYIPLMTMIVIRRMTVSEPLSFKDRSQTDSTTLGTSLYKAEAKEIRLMNFLYTETVFFSELGAMPHSKQLCGNCLGFTSGRATEPPCPAAAA